MNLEVSSELKRENSEDIDEGESEEPKKRCCWSETSTWRGIDSAPKALKTPEVIRRIVKYLPIGYVNFRLVCKFWNELCDPKLVFRKFDLQPQEIDALLRKTDCRWLNLEFQDCDLGYISDEMWKIWGLKLRSLRIYGCITQIETLQSIISNCIEIEILEIFLKCYIESNLLEQLLDYFIERREQHTRLRTLLINGQIFMKISQFLKLLTVFPGIEDFCCQTGPGDYVWEFSRCESYGTYDMRKLKSYTRVSENVGHFSERPVTPILDYQLFRMTTFKTSLEFSHFFSIVTKREQLFDFFTIQKDLEVIDFPIFGIFNENIGVSIKSLIFHILKTCSNLRKFHLPEFHVRFSSLTEKFGAITFTSEEFEEFFSLISNLQSFKLPFILKRDTSETTELPFLHPSTSLRALQLNTKEPYFFSIVKLSSQLKYLNIDVYSDQQFREIIMTMPNLKILILRLHDCTNCGFIGENEESSFRRLQKLEYLHVIDCKGKITKEVFDEFRFPRLEFLGLSLKEVENLPENLLNMPAIRTLEINFMVIYIHLMPEVLTELCKFLKNLQHLIVDNLASERELSDQYKLTIFNSLSNLRFITCYREKHTFIFDRLARKISSTETCKLQFWEDNFYKSSDRDFDCSKFKFQLFDSVPQ